MRICPRWTSALYGTLESRMTTPVLRGAIGVETWNKVLDIQNFGGATQQRQYSSDCSLRHGIILSSAGRASNCPYRR